MRIILLSLIATFAAYTSAQNVACGTGPNPFCIPQGGYFFIAGQTATVTWTPNTGSTVTLVLRSGASSNLDQGTVIVPNIPNSGSYTWTPSTDITRGSDYTIEIIDTANPSNVNYTPQFRIISDNTVASSTGPVTLVAAPTTSMSMPTEAPSSTTVAEIPSSVSSVSSEAASASSAAVMSSMSEAASASSVAVMSSMSSEMSSMSMSRSSASSISSSMAMSSSMSSGVRTTTTSRTSTRPTSTTSTGTAASQLSNTGGAGILEVSGGLLVIALGFAAM